METTALPVSKAGGSGSAASIATASTASPPSWRTRTRAPSPTPSFAAVAALKRAVRAALPSALFCSESERRTTGSPA